uniref:Shootin-1 n=1 Tax=Salvator merianae TaxID=96440 RepID=A0A8D0BHH3_SALMN
MGCYFKKYFMWKSIHNLRMNTLNKYGCKGRLDSYYIPYIFSIFLSLVSHMVIEEVSCIQSHLEIEKTCRESAEALATKLNKENKTLKRISMLCMAKLGPDIITEEINIDNEDSSADIKESSEACVSVQCQQRIKDLQDQIISLQEEKKTIAIELENLRSKFVEEITEANKIREENAVLTTEVQKHQKVLEKCNRMSVLAVEEYEELQVNFELEKNLRKRAESFAQEMFIEQNKLKRQSQLLLENSGPNEQLLKALDENAKLNQIIEEERLQHQEKVQVLHPYYYRYSEKTHFCFCTVDELQKRINQSQNVLILYFVCLGTEVTDLKRQAVEEMMDRIKKGVHLRPVNQSNRSKTKPEEPKPSESAVKELKGILQTLNTSASSRSLKSLEADSSETELERILRLRKVTTDQDNNNPAGVLANSGSKSMPVLGSIETQSELNKKTLDVEFNLKSSGTDEQCKEMAETTSSKPSTHCIFLTFCMSLCLTVMICSKVKTYAPQMWLSSDFYQPHPTWHWLGIMGAVAK